MKKDIRQEIKKLHPKIGSVVCKEDGTLQIGYYSDKDKIMNEVSRYLSINSLLQCFIKIDFIKTNGVRE